MQGLLSWARAPLLAGVGLAQVGLVLSGVLAARALGVDGRGFLATAMLVPTLAAYVGSASSDVLVAALVAQGASPRATVRTAIRVIAVPVLVSAAIAATVAHLLLRDLVVDASAAIAVIAIAATQQATGVYVGLGRDVLVAVTQAASPFLYGVATLVAFLAGVSDYRFYALLWAATAVAAAAPISVAVARSVPSAGEAPPPRSEFRRRTYVGLLSSYSPLESFRGDQILVLVTLGNGALGLYSVALALSNAAKLLGMVASWTIPGTARLEPRSRLRRVVAVSAGLLIGGIVLAATFPLLVPVLFGSDFAAAGVPAAVLGIAGALFAVRKVLVESLRLLAHEARATIIELGATVVFVALGTYLATAGILGVATALAVAAALTVVIGVWQVIRGTRRLPGWTRPAQDEKPDAVVGNA